MFNTKERDMKKKTFLSITAMAVALVTSLMVPTTALATSVTTTTEILGVARSAAEASDPQVLGARRDSSTAEGVTASKIQDKEVVTVLSTTESVTNIINNVISKINAAAGNTSVAEVKSEEITVVDAMDITPKAGTVVSEENPLYVTFSFPGLAADSEVFILHYHNGVWELVPNTVSDGQIVAKFTSFSPVAIVVKTNTLKAAVKGAKKKSPRTGDDRLLILICLGAICATSYVSSKKIFA